MYAAIEIPDLPLLAAQRAHSYTAGTHPASTPAALATPSTTRSGKEAYRNRAPLHFCNQAARDHGVHPGTTIAAALARCPDLLVLEPDPDTEARLDHHLHTLARTWSPLFERTRPGLVLLDATSLPAARLNPLSWVHHLLAASPDSTTGFPLRAALGRTPDLAHAALAKPHPLTRTLDASLDLTPVPLANIEFLPKDFLENLARWGVHTVGQLLALPAAGLHERLGDIAATFRDRLSGQHHRLLALDLEDPTYHVARELENPVETFAALEATLRPMLGDLAAQLRGRYRQASDLTVRLGHERAPDWFDGRFTLAEPSADPEKLWDLLAAGLEGLTGPAPVTHLALTASPVLPVRAQADLFSSRLKDPDAFHETLGRIGAIVGHTNLGFPRSTPNQGVDTSELLPFTRRPETATLTETQNYTPPDSYPLKRLRPPPAVHVRTAATPLGHLPVAVLDGPFPGRILHRSGPFARSGGWWRPDHAWDVYEWDVETEHHHLLRLEHDRTAESGTDTAWRIGGLYR